MKNKIIKIVEYFSFILALFIILLFIYIFFFETKNHPIFMIPLKHGWITQTPGMLPNAIRSYRNGVLECIEFNARTGTSVLAAQDGKVLKTITPVILKDDLKKAADWAKEYGFDREREILEGKTIVIKHERNWTTRYTHLDSIFVKERQNVKRGEKIGTVGNTGYSLGPHLCFNVYRPSGEYLGKGETDEYELQYLLFTYIKRPDYFINRQ